MALNCHNPRLDNLAAALVYRWIPGWIFDLDYTRPCLRSSGKHMAWVPTDKQRQVRRKRLVQGQHGRAVYFLACSFPGPGSLHQQESRKVLFDARTERSPGVGVIPKFAGRREIFAHQLQDASGLLYDIHGGSET